ncbi:carbohydrate kinase [Marinomonas rhizomae]|uniref:Erythritol kinase (L-erythritol 4-phosphate-forming) n=1 Tax=Marinomonas rhizomae TaxID=491948 RepID=A0A366J902_9GAMM|nr:FGGY-family carbohydrate kinase [Marinomonas rhizomae]RBP83506.1 erythritol kinase (L-erythritol 4-phosphate-forming) [Marinomonas rhizomae]RNF74056.1 carbohydrate kinase [Marinomonas rhizomae]
MTTNLIVGIDAGTSVVKAVAFTLDGKQVAVSSVRNTYKATSNGSATQSLSKTWDDCIAALKGLGEKIEDFQLRVVALSVTGQGDGTWLIDDDGLPVCDAWLWLDGRSAQTVDILNTQSSERQRFEKTGTGLSTCQQGVQLAHMACHYPHLIEKAKTAFHCKDWLYFNLTKVRATDPSEASFTFGDFRTRQYDDQVIASLGLSEYRDLLPDIIDGCETTHPLSAEAAKLTGLKAGIPVSLAYVDMVMTALGAGVHTGQDNVACSVIGSTGVHMRSVSSDNVFLNDQCTGYVIALPIPGRVTQVQTNMASALNLDWLLNVASDLLKDFGCESSPNVMVDRVETWLQRAEEGQLLYHPYISDAGERGPFVNGRARASFTGLTYHHRFHDLVRAVVEGLGMAMRDCYESMGGTIQELRLSGGAVRSATLRKILSASVCADVCVSGREEAGAAGAAMMAAVAIGEYKSMDDCIAEWVTPLLGKIEKKDKALCDRYDVLFNAFYQQRLKLPDTWFAMEQLREHSKTHFQVDSSDKS